jgi:hypothetical protein
MLARWLALLRVPRYTVFPSRSRAKVSSAGGARLVLVEKPDPSERPLKASARRKCFPSLISGVRFSGSRYPPCLTRLWLPVSDSLARGPRHWLGIQMCQIMLCAATHKNVHRGA